MSIKQFFIFNLLVLSGGIVFAQETNVPVSQQCSQSKINAFKHTAAKGTVADPAEDDYDMKFVRIALQVKNTSTNIKGFALTTATVTASSMSNYVFELDPEMIIDSMKFDGNLVTPTGTSVRTVVLATALPSGSSFTAQVFYHGSAPGTVSPFPKGLSHMWSPSWGNPVTFTLSESYSANNWWPTKQNLSDKIDSSEMWLTVPDTLMGGSNGILQSVTTVPGGYKQFKWKNRRPIDYYLISFAVAAYVDYSYYQHFTGSPDSVLIQNYVYNNPATLTFYQDRIDSVGLTIDYFSKIFGRYPFWQQKYGHCMAPISGGMEHQTMTTLGNFGTVLTAHELGHQWWGDNVTCATWADTWLNEGFASYCEYLFYNHFYSATDAFNDMADRHDDIMSETGGTVYVNDTTDENRVFSSRLTYNKGAAVVHTLRFIAGSDSLFFAGLLHYRNLYQNGVANTDNLRDALEETWGIDLDTVFNEWVYSEGFPTFSASWNQIAGTAFVHLSQTTSMPGSVPAFHVPVELKLKSAMGDTTVVVYLDNASQDYSFDWASTMNGLQIDPSDWLINGLGSIIHDGTLEIDNTIGNGLHIYPNPSNSIWNIKGLKAGSIITLTDIAGKTILSQQVIGDQQLNANDLQPGIYLLEILENNGNRNTYRLLRK